MLNFLLYIGLGELGALLSVLITVLFRNKESERTPYKFSRSFLWNDNKKRFFVVPIMIIIAVFILPVAAAFFNLEWYNKDHMPGYAALIGLFSDAIIFSYKDFKKKKLIPNQNSNG